MKQSFISAMINVATVFIVFSLFYPTGAEAGQIPSDYDQYLLELINRGRLSPAAEATRYGVDLNEGLAPGTITTSPKQPLAFNPYLIDAAQNHSQWMLDVDVFSHTGNSGSSPTSRIQAAGYVFTAPYGDGENIGYWGTTGALDLIWTVEEIHRSLYRDDDYEGRGHRKNQLNPDFKEIGTGVREGVFTEQGTGYNSLMVTEDFAYSAGSYAGKSFITGVVWQDTVVADGFYSPGGEGLGNISVSATNTATFAVYTTTTWGSGGFSLPVPNGTYIVAASGAGLGGTVTYSNIVVATQNVKLDFSPGQATSDPEIAVVIKQDIVNGSDSPTRAAGTDFGSVGQGQPGPHRIVAVFNHGGSDLTLGAVQLPVGFTLIESLDSVISAGGHDTFIVRLASAAPGTFAGTINMTTNDPDEDPFTFGITGRVNPPGTGVVLADPMQNVCTVENAAPIVIDLLRHFDDIGVDGTLVRMDSNIGSFDIELSDNVTPITVQNFLNYVEDGDYTDSFIHRAITMPNSGYDFVIQGGGYAWYADAGGYSYVPTDAPIVNEFDNWFNTQYGGQEPGTPINVQGTVAMAKLAGDPDSATSQFFINLEDNSAELDSQNGGFTVFGTVALGQSAVEAIADLPVYDAGSPFDSLPLYNFPGGTIEREHVVLFDNVLVINELSFSITANANPGLVAPTIGSDGTLTLTLTENQTGRAQITVQATDREGGTAEDTLEISVNSIPLDKGDVNADGTVTLHDAVLGLKLLTQSAGTIPGLASGLPCIDVNADGKVGLEEVSYILQQVAELR